MDHEPIRLPVATAAVAERTLTELIGVIDLVAAGVARRVVLVSEPEIEAVAPLALAHAQSLGVRFALDRDSGHRGPLVIVGPPAS